MPLKLCVAHKQEPNQPHHYPRNCAVCKLQRELAETQEALKQALERAEQVNAARPKKRFTAKEKAAVRKINQHLDLRGLSKSMPDKEWNLFISLLTEGYVTFSGDPTGFHLTLDGAVVDDCRHNPPPIKKAKNRKEIERKDIELMKKVNECVAHPALAKVLKSKAARRKVTKLLANGQVVYDCTSGFGFHLMESPDDVVVHNCLPEQEQG